MSDKLQPTITRRAMIQSTVAVTTVFGSGPNTATSATAGVALINPEKITDDGVDNPYRATGNQYDVVTTPLPAGIQIDHQVRIPMRDGIKLAASVYTPAQGGKCPVIVAISPYGKTKFKAIEIFKKVPNNHIGHIAISDSVSFEAPDPGFWVPSGYVVVQVDVRGQGDSEGAFGFPPEQVHIDFVDVIDWASKQPWSSGNIGCTGVSYLAISQWWAAQHRPPALKAIIPWEGLTDQYRRNYLGGIQETGMSRFVVQDWIIPNKNPDAPTIPPKAGMAPSDHPLIDGYWQHLRLAIERVEIPVLICASFSDQALHTRDSFENFNIVGSKQKWLYNHRQPKWASFYSPEALMYQRDFLDHFLKGIDNGFDKLPRVRLNVHSDREHYKVVTTNDWPPEGNNYKQLFLGAGGSLAEHASTEAASVTYIAADERVRFDHIFSSPVDLVGNMKLKLWVEAVGADDMDLFVGVQKFDRSGKQVYFYGFGGVNANDLVARGWLRVSHRALDAGASRPDRPVHLHTKEEKLSPGQIVPVEVELLPSGTSFVAGESLRIIVQGSPIEPDASILHFHANNSGSHKIWMGGKYDSFLLVPSRDEIWRA